MPSFLRAYPPARPARPAEGLLVAFSGEDLLLTASGLPTREAANHLLLEDALYLGDLDGVPCLACSLSDDELRSTTFLPTNLRKAYALLPEEHWLLAAYATQLLRWETSARFCMQCASPLERVSGEWSRRCLACARITYPPLYPCVIVIVHDDDRLIMTHLFSRGTMHGLVAGFVEPGESLEEALRREVKEEVGVEVSDIEYFGSQPWPFPHQIMIGFFARYAGGEIVPQTSEIDEAGWFSVDAMPPLPPPLSIARRMLDAWIARRRSGRL